MSYKFKSYENFWHQQDNRDLALKQFIENDLNLHIDKIPLYLTLENIRKHSNTIRNVLRKYYNNNIYLWVNEIYPDKFIEEDFNVIVLRNVFDSIEENQIDDILRQQFTNVIYNQRNTPNTIKIYKSIPDWFIFTNNGVYVVEYFGISIDQKQYNKRISGYVQKTKNKIDKYKLANGYNFIYLYPDDLKNNYNGLYEKIKTIK